MKNRGLKHELGLEGIDFKPIFIIIAILCIAITFSIDYQTPLSFRKIVRVSLISMFLGLIIENYRITKNWRHVIYLFIGTYALSLSWFLSKKGRDVENYLVYWPYYFAVIFVLVSISLYSKKITQTMSEGVTLLFSLAFTYWLIEKGFFNLNGFFHKLITVLSMLFLIFSVKNGLSYKQLTKTQRLAVSIGTTIILIVISLDNSCSIIQSGISNMSDSVSGTMLLSLNYFLLGISSVYIAQNIIMTYILLDKDARTKTKKWHIDRFSEDQVLKEDSILCIVFSTTFYALNFIYELLSSNLVIWLVVFTFPILLELKNIVLKNISTHRGKL